MHTCGPTLSDSGTRPEKKRLFEFRGAVASLVSSKGGSGGGHGQSRQNQERASGYEAHFIELQQ